jgi:hypothetical protein
MSPIGNRILIKYKRIFHVAKGPAAAPRKPSAHPFDWTTRRELSPMGGFLSEGWVAIANSCVDIAMIRFDRAVRISRHHGHRH